MSDTEQVLSEAAAWRHDGLEVALATVVSTWGSSPRPVGSKLAVNDSGQMTGSVSGGCVEGAVVHTALEIMRTEKGLPVFGIFGVKRGAAVTMARRAARRASCAGRGRKLVWRVRPGASCMFVT